MTPAKLIFGGLYYPEDRQTPFVEEVYEPVGKALGVLTLSFLWEAAALKEICQARLAGFVAQGNTLEVSRRLTLHDSDFCRVYATQEAAGKTSPHDMTIEVVEKVITFEGKEYPVLTQGCQGKHWAAHPVAPTFGSVVVAEQLGMPVRVMGAFAKVHDGELVTNLIYGLRQTDEPHPREKVLKEEIERVRKGARFPWQVPRVAVGTIFAREVQKVKP